MVIRVLVRSRIGNVVLAALGAIYTLSAIAVLGWYIVDVWHANTLRDFVLQVALVASAACGVWFVTIALENLRDAGRHHRSGASKAASIQR